jgi:uncharacterized protein YwgA
MTEREDNLALFVKELEDNGIFKFSVRDNEDSNFYNRLRLQKYVYIVKYFGLDLGYSYNMYLHGPYSSSLADDYFSIEPFYPDYYDDSNKHLGNFGKSEFIDLIKDRSPDWLEAAATLLSLSEYFKDRDCLLTRTTNMKHHIPKKEIESILKELENKRLVAFN